MGSADAKVRTVDFKAEYVSRPSLRSQPVARRILFENLLRHDDGTPESREAIAAVAAGAAAEIGFWPSRVLMQDYAGMPALIDLAALRDAAARAGYDPAAINPKLPVDLVVDHSVMAHVARRSDAFARNLELELTENAERYGFLKWAAQAFDDVRIVPPGQGIVHQINTEVLATVVAESARDGVRWRHPDTLVGTDSHTTMVNGIGVLGWGVGGIEAEAAMLGEAMSMLAPRVVGVRLRGAAPVGALATDIVLTLTEFLRTEGVVGVILEFFGPGVARLTAADRLTIANMAPEFGATAAFFPVDDQTLDYLRMTGRPAGHVARVERHLRDAGLFYDADFTPRCDRTLDFDLSAVGRVVAGPSRPEQKRALSEVPASFLALAGDGAAPDAALDGAAVSDGSIVIASITSCTNTANAATMIAAGLLARKARSLGLTVASHIKTSLAPGSRAVAGYLEKLDLLDDLAALGFDIVAFGCTTCVGNSGDLLPEVQDAIAARPITVASVLSGNRNFEARVHPNVAANYLASPPLVVAYALAGTVRRDLEREPIASAPDGTPVMLEDLWPADEEISEMLSAAAVEDAYRMSGDALTEGGSAWRALPAPSGARFPWDADSTYLREPPFFTLPPQIAPTGPVVHAARPLLVLPDRVTTDHISPVGRIASDSPAADALRRKGVSEAAFNAYGARRGDHDVMTRGTFANVRLSNRLSARPGGWTTLMPDGIETSVYEAAGVYQRRGEDAIVVAGHSYGAGSARDWAAKGARLLGVKAVLAESFERIHRANLVRMGVAPVEIEGKALLADWLISHPDARVTVRPDPKDAHLTPNAPLRITSESTADRLSLAGTLRAETSDELDYLLAGGILPFIAARWFGRAGERPGSADS